MAEKQRWEKKRGEKRKGSDDNLSLLDLGFHIVATTETSLKCV